MDRQKPGGPTATSGAREITLKQIQDQKQFVRQYCETYMNQAKGGDDAMDHSNAGGRKKQGFLN